FPSCGQAQARLVDVVRGGPALRIEHDEVPIEYRELIRRSRIETAAIFTGRHIIEGRLKRSCAGRDLQVEGVHVHLVAVPGDRLALGGQMQVDQVRDGA